MINCPLHSSMLFTYWLVHFSTFSQRSRQWSTLRSTTGQCAEIKSLWTVHHWVSISLLLPTKFENHYGSGDRKVRTRQVDICRKPVSASHDSFISHMNSQQLWLYIQKLYNYQASHNLSKDREGDHAIGNWYLVVNGQSVFFFSLFIYMAFGKLSILQL